MGLFIFNINMKVFQNSFFVRLVFQLWDVPINLYYFRWKEFPGRWNWRKHLGGNFREIIPPSDAEDASAANFFVVAFLAILDNSKTFYFFLKNFHPPPTYSAHSEERRPLMPNSFLNFISSRLILEIHLSNTGIFFGKLCEYRVHTHV